MRCKNSREKQVEAAAFEETKVASNKSDTCQADQSGAHHEERDVHSDFKIACYNGSRKVLDVSNSSRGRSESEKTGGDDDAKTDLDMSILPSDSRNSQYKSRSYSLLMPSETEYPSERMAHQDNYVNHTVPEPCTSAHERAPYEDSYFRNMDEYGVASVENHFSFSTDNVGAGSRMYNPSLEELTGLYAGDPTGNLYSSTSGGTGRSFYRSQNFEDYSVYCSKESAGSSQRSLVPGRGVQENARMYGGDIRDNPQTAMNPSVTDIRAQIRMYGGQSTYDHPHTMRYSSGSVDARFVGSASSSTYGMASLGSTGRSAIDKYAPYLEETNYATGPYNVPDFKRDTPPDPVNVASRLQYPYPRSGSSGGWLG